MFAVSNSRCSDKMICSLERYSAWNGYWKEHDRLGCLTETQAIRLEKKSRNGVNRGKSEQVGK